MGSIREVTKSDGTKTYHVEVRLRGHPPQRESFRTRSQAKQWIQDTESSIRDGRHFKTTESKRHTVGELIDRFIVQWLPNYPKSQIKQTALLSWWKDRLGHLLLADLTPSVIAEARDALLHEKTVRKKIRSPSTVNRYLAAFSKALSIAVKEWGWIEDTPMRKVTKPGEAPGRERFLSLEEKERLLNACKNSPNQFLYSLVSLSIHTGMRFGEIIRLQWEDIDFINRAIVLHETKNGDRRVIPLTDTAKLLFESCPTYNTKPSGPIFKSHRTNNKNGFISVRQAFQNALKVAEIKNFRWHDLRHTAASYLAMNGATQGELMAILGHRSPHMTRRYAHYSQAHIRKILESTGGTII